MADLAVYEQRRFSSVLLSHPRLTDFASFAEILSNAGADHKRLALGRPTWSAERFEYLYFRSLYPESRHPPEMTRRDGGYAHQLYFAARGELASLRVPVVVLASPYVRLLAHVTAQLKEGLQGPALRYLAVNMRQVYQSFANAGPDMTPSRVTLQITNEPDLELVSLAGKNPLRSDLHAALSEVATPYSLRTDMSSGGVTCRVNLDRHGNVWWHQTGEEALAVPLLLVDRLEQLGALHLTRLFPLDRAEKGQEQ
jgi:hypothetical protein